MKKLLTLFAFAATMLSFAACSSDDDPSIVGTWKGVKSIEYASPSDKTGHESLPYDTETTTITFNSDGTFTRVYTDTANPRDNETVTGTYTIKGGKIYANNDESDAAEYRFSGDNTLILTYYNEEYDIAPEDGYKYVYYYSRQ